MVGKTARPTFALTLVYDKEWQIVTEQIGNIRLELFIGPQFRPTESVIVKEFTDNYGFLSRRFGSPRAGYFGVVEARSKEGNGWHFASNQVVVAAGRPRVFAVKDGRPRAFFGHEVGHLWTHGTGPAANFLSEGWATYVESVILEQKYGMDIAKLYWKSLAEEYFSQFDGKLSLLEDENNSGVAYQKGAWVFRMLELAVGPTNFDRAMAEFSRRSLERPADWDELAECFNRLRVPEFDARAFLLPWLKEKDVPRLSTRIDGKRVAISQTGAHFRLPLTVEVTTAQGTQRRMLWLQDKDTIVDWPDEPQAVTLDPDQQLLVRRN